MTHAGLTLIEAQSRLVQYGPNVIQDSSRTSPFKILLRQVEKNVIVYFLLFGALISLFVGEAITAYSIFGVIILITITGFVQEYRAEQAIQALKTMITPKGTVVRDGKEQIVQASEIVPGDLLVLRIGERIPADCTLIESNEFRVNESILTGESGEVDKRAEHIAYMGTYAVNGKCKAIVTHTGMNTKFGGIAALISETQKSMPLQEKMNHIARSMVIAALVISFLTGIIMISRVTVWTPQTISEVLIFMIALSVSAFPEGLPVVLITTLAIGATRMAKKNAIVNRMSIIETLGETTVICSDKTGTITKGEMTVKKIIIDHETIEVTGTGYNGKGEFLQNNNPITINHHPHLHLLIQAALAASDAKIEPVGEDYSVMGSPTEGALLVMAAKGGMLEENSGLERISLAPFNSKRKMMSVLATRHTHSYIYAKGAVEVLLSKCTHIQHGEKVLNLTEQERHDIMIKAQALGNEAYRLIAFAYKPTPSTLVQYEESDFIYLGMAALEDPPREEVKESIALCHQAGIDVKMITGDHKETAMAVAQQIELTGRCVDGDELKQMTDDELSRSIKDIAIFARVQPEDKIRIVTVLKKNGEIVTMTGDGVNDAPALKEAHVGVAMGKNGTDVSRSVADLTLKDDNFATIVEAIKEGRSIFTNIQKFSSYQLSCNWAELIILFLGVLLSPITGWGVPVLLAMQILFMNLVTDDLPAITLGLNHAPPDVMSEKPRKNVPILTPYLVKVMIFTSVVVSVLTLISFYIAHIHFDKDIVSARTSAMLCLILLEVTCAFNYQSFRHPVLRRSPLTNPYLFYASLASLLITLLVLYTPLGNTIFETAPLTLSEWVFPLFSAFFITALFDKMKKHGIIHNNV